MEKTRLRVERERCCGEGCSKAQERVAVLARYTKAKSGSSNPSFDGQNKEGPEVARRTSVGSSAGASKASSTDSLLGVVVSSFGEFQEVKRETEER